MRCVSCCASRHDLCPRHTDHPGDLAGDLKSRLVLIAVSAGGLVYPVIESVPANVTDDLGGYVAKQDRLIAGATIFEVILIKSARVTRPELSENCRPSKGRALRGTGRMLISASCACGRKRVCTHYLSLVCVA
jgi:hypothetical protein